MLNTGEIFKSVDTWYAILQQIQCDYNVQILPFQRTEQSMENKHIYMKQLMGEININDVNNCILNPKKNEMKKQDEKQIHSGVPMEIENEIDDWKWFTTLHEQSNSQLSSPSEAFCPTYLIPTYEKWTTLVNNKIEYTLKTIFSLLTKLADTGKWKVQKKKFMVKSTNGTRQHECRTVTIKNAVKTLEEMKLENKLLAGLIIQCFMPDLSKFEYKMFFDHGKYLNAFITKNATGQLFIL
jgi:hypothetical protein